MNINKLLWGCFLPVLFVIPVAGQHPKQVAAVQFYLDSVRQACGFPAVRATVMAGNQAPFTVVSGYANLENKTPLKANDLLLSGSTPKLFYATLTLLLAEEGRLNLDDKLSRYLGAQSWFLRLPNATDITLRQLLNHTAGVPEYYELGDCIKRLREEPDKNWSLEELIAYVLDQAPLNKAGEKFGYADTHYLLLGMALEKVLGHSVHPEIKRRILKPLGMRRTIPSQSRRIKGLVCGYSMPNSPFGFSGATIRDGLFVINPQVEQMGGGYVSTTEDWVRFIYGLMNGRILSPKSLEAMKTGVAAPITAADDQYGLGMQIRLSPKGTGFGHGGWFPGYLTEVEYFPEAGIAIAIQFNTDDFKQLKGHPRKYTLALLKRLTDQ
ncbi:MAG: beta-lactamase family protein [Saprospiraceae bacterium]|nr:beta-lactamase family protein [Saprospiraceae bacterium]